MKCEIRNGCSVCNFRDGWMAAIASIYGTNEQVSDDAIRSLWRSAGGKFYGPNVETGTMPEAKLLPFLRSLGAVKPTETDSSICGDDGPITADQCALWLDAKYRRTGELEDRAAAMWLRKLSARSAAETNGKRCFACGHPVAPLSPEMQTRLDAALAGLDSPPKTAGEHAIHARVCPDSEDGNHVLKQDGPFSVVYCDACGMNRGWRTQEPENQPSS